MKAENKKICGTCNREINEENQSYMTYKTENQTTGEIKSLRYECECCMMRPSLMELISGDFNDCHTREDFSELIRQVNDTMIDANLFVLSFTPTLRDLNLIIGEFDRYDEVSTSAEKLTQAKALTKTYLDDCLAML